MPISYSKQLSLMKYLLLLFYFLNIGLLVFAQAEKIWETEAVFKFPETVVLDNKRECLYISNLSQIPADGLYYGNDFVSKMTKSGEIVQLDWIDNLTSPTGLGIFKDKLYIVERFGVVEYDLEGDSISNKFLIKNAGFLNDIAIDDKGNIYISDTDNNTIHRIEEGKVENWIESDEITKINGILYDNGKLILGVNGDKSVKSVDIQTKDIEHIARIDFEQGAIDGIEKIGNDYLVSNFYGVLYQVKKDGSVKEILNFQQSQTACANFAYIEKEKLLLVPAMWNHKVIGMRVNF